ncbi:MAG: ATP-binding protein [Candidatus Methylomirabilis sp.]|nr:ATP-binding protein [Candidatus Methylomirabilis sp.]
MADPGVQTRTGIRCQLDVGLDGYEPDRETSTTLFRILQEALTNVVRHAGATAVNISLILDQDRLILAVVDNGRGITEQEMTDSNALGLLGMRERALLFGGEVTITGESQRRYHRHGDDSAPTADVSGNHSTLNPFGLSPWTPFVLSLSKERTVLRPGLSKPDTHTLRQAQGERNV